MQIMQPSRDYGQTHTAVDTTPVVGKPYPIPGHRNTLTLQTDGTWQVGPARRIAPLKGHTTAYGHLEYGFTTDKGKTNRMQVGRAVLLTFKGPPSPGDECCHNDGNPANNHLDNLRWGTRQENVADMFRHGTHNRQKLTDQQVAEIRAKFCDQQESGPPPGSQRWLMQKYQLSQTTVSNILRGITRTDSTDQIAAAIRAEYTGPERRYQNNTTKRLAAEYGVTAPHISRIVRNISRWSATDGTKATPTPRSGDTLAAAAGEHLLSPSQFSRIARGLSRTNPRDTEAAAIRERYA